MKDVNASAYQYQVAVQDKFNVICGPLFKLGIKYFLYGKAFQDGKYLLLVNNLAYVKTYLETIKSHGSTFTKQINTIEKNNSHIYFLRPDITKFDKRQDSIMHLMYDFNIWPPFYIYKGSSPNFIEFYCFSGENNDDFFHSFCLNNISLLNHFCGYFNERAAHLVECTDQGKLACFEQQLNFYNTSQEDLLAQRIEQFLQETCIRKRILKTPERDVSLSKREVECLNYLSLGKSAKEIAKILDLSPRSIEFYFRNIKQKSGLKRGELLTCFVKSNFLNDIL